MSIARQIELDDPYEKLGAELVKEVAKKTDETAGDGTTTATVLAQALVREGLRNVAAGANPIALKRGIEQAVAAVTEALGRQARDVETREQVAATASISAADSAVGEMIAEAMDKAGREGVGTGAASPPYFITDLERLEAVLDDPYLLIVEDRISHLDDLLPLLEEVMRTGKPLVIVAEDVEGQALAAKVTRSALQNAASVAALFLTTEVLVADKP